MISLFRSLGYAKLLLALLDVVVLAAIALLILTLRIEFFRYGSVTDQAIFFALSSLAAVPIFRELNLYKHKVFSTGADQIIGLGKGMLFVGILQIIVIFLVKHSTLLDYSRVHILLYIVCGWAGLSVMRVGIFRKLHSRTYGTGAAKRRVLAVGAGEAGQEFATRIYEQPQLGLTLVGFLDDDPAKIGKQLLGRHIHGRVDSVAECAEKLDVQEIYITVNKIEYSRLLEIIEMCRKTHLPVTVTADHFSIIPNKIGTSEYDYIDSLTLRPRDLTTASWRIKRLIDVIGSATLLTLLSPALAAIALAVKLTSEGPVFYKCQVVGRKGKLFTWYKFRTMRVNRDEAIHRDHLKKIIRENKTTKKIENDPRITSVGGSLRKYSLDELPQLINVLRGEMSLIGPRPCLQYEFEHFDDWHKQRFHVTPGMTGLWQVVGRNKSDVTFNDSIILDIYYIQNFSLWLDAKILIKTVPTVLFGRGGA